MRRVRALAILPFLVACAGPQSALVPAGREAGRIASLWWWLAGGAALIWVAVVALLLFAYLWRDQRPDREPLLILGGGVVVPVIVLTIVLIAGLRMLPEMTARAPDADLRIDVSGEEWWWRVRYVGADGEAIETANEIRLPLGRRAGFTLASPDVIHSLWIPSLGGKRDLVPGRVNHLVLEPTRTGTFRGACAEYCGTSHAHMLLDVVVMEPGDFDAWLRAQGSPAAGPGTAVEQRGRDLFLASGCGACHTVRGTPANGRVGPDLTHFGSRPSLGAGTLPNNAGTLARWIEDPSRFKPEARMPAFGMLPDADILAIAAYLSGLE